MHGNSSRFSDFTQAMLLHRQEQAALWSELSLLAETHKDLRVIETMLYDITSSEFLRIALVPKVDLVKVTNREVTIDIFLRPEGSVRLDLMRPARKRRWVWRVSDETESIEGEATTEAADQIARILASIYDLRIRRGDELPISPVEAAPESAMVSVIELLLDWKKADIKAIEAVRKEIDALVPKCTSEQRQAFEAAVAPAITLFREIQQTTVLLGTELNLPYGYKILQGFKYASDGLALSVHLRGGAEGSVYYFFQTRNECCWALGFNMDGRLDITAEGPTVEMALDDIRHAVACDFAEYIIHNHTMGQEAQARSLM